MPFDNKPAPITSKSSSTKEKVDILAKEEANTASSSPGPFYELSHERRIN